MLHHQPLNPGVKSTASPTARIPEQGIGHICFIWRNGKRTGSSWHRNQMNVYFFCGNGYQKGTCLPGPLHTGHVNRYVKTNFNIYKWENGWLSISHKQQALQWIPCRRFFLKCWPWNDKLERESFYQYALVTCTFYYLRVSDTKLGGIPSAYLEHTYTLSQMH